MALTLRLHLCAMEVTLLAVQALQLLWRHDLEEALVAALAQLRLLAWRLQVAQQLLWRDLEEALVAALACQPLTWQELLAWQLQVAHQLLWRDLEEALVAALAQLAWQLLELLAWQLQWARKLLALPWRLEQTCFLSPKLLQASYEGRQKSRSCEVAIREVAIRLDSARPSYNSQTSSFLCLSPGCPNLPSQNPLRQQAQLSMPNAEQKRRLSQLQARAHIMNKHAHART